MFRKGIVFLILTSMMLHCASRINFLSYLYEQRHTIAYEIGLIAEVPIALCSSEYDFDKGLKIHTHNDEKSTLPTFSQAREIMLFFQTASISINPVRELTIKTPLTLVCQKKYTPPAFPVFHPPA